MTKRIDLTGQKFGMWTVLEYLGNLYYLCRCDCGTTRKIYTGNLRNGKTKSCGCANKDDFIGKKIGKLTVLRKLPKTKSYTQYECQCDCGKIFVTSDNTLKSKYNKSCPDCRKSRVEDISGKRFGRLVAIRYAGKSKGNQTLWECKCDCGNISIVHQQDLTTGHTKSCGCYSRESIIQRNKTHGDTKTRIYRIWSDMLFRCSSVKHDSYYLYGGKGISVCDEWKDYNNFKKWALENGYSDNLSIDRIDSSKNYEPSNCRWATIIEQNNNTNRNLMFEIDGTTKSLAEWCREYNASYARVHSRIYSGWNIIDALTRPFQSLCKLKKLK
jgi:hypothetical protein